MSILVRVISWVCLLFTIAAMICSFSDAARMLESVSIGSRGSIRVVVRVICDGCFEQPIANKSIFLPGATVAVECKDHNDHIKYTASSITDGRGQSFMAIPNEIVRSKEIESEKCFVRILSSPHTSCNVNNSLSATAPTAAAHLVLKSRKGRKHVYITVPFVCHPPFARTFRAATSTIDQRKTAQLESHEKASAMKVLLSEAKSHSLDKQSKRTRPSFSFPFAPPFQLPSPSFQLPPGGLTSPLPFVQPPPPGLPLPPFLQPPSALPPLFPLPNPPPAGFLPSPGFPFLGQPPPS